MWPGLAVVWLAPLAGFVSALLLNLDRTFLSTRVINGTMSYCVPDLLHSDEFRLGTAVAFLIPVLMTSICYLTLMVYLRVRQPAGTALFLHYFAPHYGTAHVQSAAAV